MRILLWHVLHSLHVMAHRHVGQVEIGRRSVRKVRDNHRIGHAPGLAEKDQIVHLDDSVNMTNDHRSVKRKTYTVGLARIHDRLDVIASTIYATRVRDNQLYLLKPTVITTLQSSSS